MTTFISLLLGIILFHDWLHIIKSESPLSILYEKYRKIGRKPSREKKNINKNLEMTN